MVANEARQTFDAGSVWFIERVNELFHEQIIIFHTARVQMPRSF